jgi:hypothetical protein
VSPSTITNGNQNELARTLKHEGVRIGEIIAYRAWRVIHPSWFRSGDDHLHSVFMQDYIWPRGEPACGDIRTHGIYSFRDLISSREEYGYTPCSFGPLLFGKVKIWGEIVEHEAGYRSQFGKIVSLDYGDPELLDKFRKVYRVNQTSGGHFQAGPRGRNPMHLSTWRDMRRTIPWQNQELYADANQFGFPGGPR